jgi:hypothetical protein
VTGAVGNLALQAEVTGLAVHEVGAKASPKRFGIAAKPQMRFCICHPGESRRPKEEVMKRSFGVLLSAVSSAMALAVTSAPAMAQNYPSVETDSQYQLCNTGAIYSAPECQATYTLGQASVTDFASGITFTCGGTTVIPNYILVPDVQYLGPFQVKVTAFCSNWRSVETPWVNNVPETTLDDATCPAGSVVWYGDLKTEC